MVTDVTANENRLNFALRNAILIHMTKNPVVNAVAASLYITLVATVMQNAETLFGSARSIVVPIAMISLFTLSAAMMGYLFLYQPLQLYLDGKKKQATNLFVQTLGVFAGITILVFASLYIGSLKK